MNGLLSSPLILIVDDDHTTTVVLEGLLKGAGFETLCAHDLAGARKLIPSNPVSLMLLDLNLPDGNGLDLCRQIYGSAGFPVLFISGSDDIQAKVSGFAAGGVDYITKPLAGAEVLARVRTHLRLRAAYESLLVLHSERIGRIESGQRSLMPLPESLPEARFGVCMRQALRAGGDFYDVIPSGTRITDYIVADASGHDLGTSLWTVSFKTLLGECSTVLFSPRDVFRMLNVSLKRILPEGTYFTALSARVNRATGKMILANAGHPSAILVRDGEALLLEQDGDLLGIFADAEFGMLEMTVRPEDRLFLYTDGLVEASGSRSEGIARLKSACLEASGQEAGKAVDAIVAAMDAGTEPEDDIVLLGIDI